MSSRECMNPTCDAERNGPENFCSASCEMEWVNDRLTAALQAETTLKARVAELEEELKGHRCDRCTTHCPEHCAWGYTYPAGAPEPKED